MANHESKSFFILHLILNLLPVIPNQDLSVKEHRNARDCYNEKCLCYKMFVLHLLGGLGSLGFTVGLNALKGLLQP